MPIIFQSNPSTPVLIQGLPSIANDIDALTYLGGGGALFPNLVLDTVVEPGNYFDGNPFIQETFTVKSDSNLTVTVETKEVLSPNEEKGLFDVVYPNDGSDVTGRISYYWDKVYTSPVGIYTSQGSAAGWTFNINNEILQISMNDVNIIPRTGNYIAFNVVPTNFAVYNSVPPDYDGTQYVNGYLNSRLPMFKGTEFMQAQITDVLLLSGIGKDSIYQLTLDKSFLMPNGVMFAITLLNRDNTDIQKELFYDTFENIEVHRQQLIGDPYNNTSLVTVPAGRKNYLNYTGASALGYANLLNNIINGQNTPVLFFDINDEIRDRFSYITNVYDANNNPIDIHFELHLPGVLINENVWPGSNSVVDSNGNVIENIFVASPNVLEDVGGAGKYAGIYLKSDTTFSNRYGYVMYDLRIIVIDNSELVLALGYNSNRSYTLPQPTFVPGSGNSLINFGVGTNLNIVNASNTSPIVITTSSPHKLVRGTKIAIRDVQGNTAANGEWFVDYVYTDQTNQFTLELWQQLPQYNPDNTRVVPLSGIPSVGNGIFVNNGAGNSGIIIGALPDYNYFYTYRVRNDYQPSTLPYAAITNFNFTKGGNIDNIQGSLFVSLSQFNWAQGSGSLNNGYGYSILTELQDAGYGIDIIVGQYTVNQNDPLYPNKITGIQNVMCIPLRNLNAGFTGAPDQGIVFELKKVQDYDVAVISSNTFGSTNYTYDIYNNMPIYNYTTSVLSTTLLTGNGKWTIGNIKFRNLAEVYRTTMSIYIPASAWNDTTNPTYDPVNNSFISNKFISEIALIGDGDDTNTPKIYAKIAPVIQKSNTLDIVANITVDF